MCPFYKSYVTKAEGKKEKGGRKKERKRSLMQKGTHKFTLVAGDNHRGIQPRYIDARERVRTRLRSVATYSFRSNARSSLRQSPFRKEALIWSLKRTRTNKDVTRHLDVRLSISILSLTLSIMREPYRRTKEKRERLQESIFGCV